MMNRLTCCSRSPFFTKPWKMLTTRVQLALATWNDQSDSMRLLISHSKAAKADVSHPSVKTELLFMTERRPNCVESLSVLLEAGVDVNTVSDKNSSLLMLAMLNSEAVVRTVLEYGPDLTIRDADGDTVLTMINEDTSSGSIKRAVRMGAKVDVVDNDGRSPLMWAIMWDNWDVFQYLMTLDAVKSNLNLLSDTGTALQYACFEGNIEAVKALLEHGANIDLPREGYVGTPIMEAITRRHDDIVELLLQKGAQLDRPAGSLYLPSFAACLRGSRDLVRSLLEKNSVSAEVVDGFGRRPVHLACYNSAEVLDELNPPEDDFAATDYVGRVPLHYACLSGDIDLMKAVLERSKSVGVGIDVQDNDGWTPLLWAARASPLLEESGTEEEHLEVVSWLISQGADPMVRVEGVESNHERGGDGWTVIEVAQYHGAEGIVDFLTANVKLDEKRSQKSRRIGEVVSGTFCDCCLIVRDRIPLTDLPYHRPPSFPPCQASSCKIFMVCKGWALTLCRHFAEYSSIASFASTGLTCVSNASAPKTKSTLRTLWSKAAMRKSFIPHRNNRDQMRGNLSTVKAPMMRLSTWTR